MSFLLPHGEDAAEALANPFEAWCAATGVHPEHPSAWFLFEQNAQVAAVETETQTPAAS